MKGAAILTRAPGALLIALASLAPVPLLAQGTSRLEREGQIRDLQRTARVLLENGRLRESLPYLRRLAELQPYDEVQIYRLALALLYQDGAPAPAAYEADLKQAIVRLEDCVARQLRVAERGEALGLRLFHLGVAYWYAGDLGRAYSAFERSQRADFLRLDALYNMYAIQEELGHAGEAAMLRNRYRKLVARQDLDD